MAADDLRIFTHNGADSALPEDRRCDILCACTVFYPIQGILSIGKD